MSFDFEKHMSLFDAPDLTNEEKLEYLKKLKTKLQVIIDQSFQERPGTNEVHSDKMDLQSPKDSIKSYSKPLVHSFKKPASLHGEELC